MLILAVCAGIAALELRGTKYANRFIVRDDGSTERAVFGIDDSGNFGIYLKDVQGKERAAFYAVPDGNTVLGMSSSSGDPQAVLITHEDGSVEINLRDIQGRTRAGIAVEKDGASSLALVDKDGNPRAMLRAFPDGAVRLVFNGPKGESRLSLLAHEHDGAGLEVQDAQGLARAIFGVESNGVPFTALLGPDESNRIRIFADEESTGLFMTDPNKMYHSTLFASTGGATVSVGAQHQSIRASLGTYSEGNRSVLRMDDTDGISRAILELNHGIPRFAMYDDHGKTRAALFLRPNGTPRQTLLDHNEGLLWSAP